MMAGNHTGPAPADDEVIALSALAHFTYCPRRCALIYVESVFDENVYTLRGRDAHERADTAGWESAEGARVERALPLWSDALGLNGRADIVEFRADGTVYPVEYKHGARRPHEPADVQLCAQALCLEEMTGLPAPRGAVYYHGSRRRAEVEFTPELRSRVAVLIDEVRLLIVSGASPPPANDARCPNCSLNDVCMPEVALQRRYQYLERGLYTTEGDDPEGADQ